MGIAGNPHLGSQTKVAKIEKTAEEKKLVFQQLGGKIG